MKLTASLFALVCSIANGASATATVAQSATLAVTANGTAPFTYQWSKDGVALSGATANPLQIASLTVADAGNYTVKVSNSAGSTTSDIASLQVDPVATAPDLTKQYARATLARAQDNPLVLPAGIFTTIKGASIDDPGSHYNAATGFYTVGTGETGRYQVIIRARADDMAPEAISYGISADTANQDSAAMLWCTTFAHGTVWMRNGAVNIVERSFAAGDQIRVLIYATQDLKILGVDFTIKRLN
jgi:hypothetical protein